MTAMHAHDQQVTMDEVAQQTDVDRDLDALLHLDPELGWVNIDLLLAECGLKRARKAQQLKDSALDDDNVGLDTERNEPLDEDSYPHGFYAGIFAAA